jgi:hypothetical protein
MWALVVSMMLVATVSAAAPATTHKAAPAAKRPAAHAAPAAGDSSHHGAATPAPGTPQPGAKPSFAGSWKLSLDRSVFGNVPGGKPAERLDVIEQEGTRLRQRLFLRNGSRRDTTIYVYSTDGTPTVNKVDGRDIKTTAQWDGDVLHLVSVTKLLMFTMTLDERWSLSPDAKTLTYKRHVKYGFGEGDQTLVFERE